MDESITKMELNILYNPDHTSLEYNSLSILKEIAIYYYANFWSDGCKSISKEARNANNYKTIQIKSISPLSN